ncbi:obscurin-like [Anneissia japonica]|uniref:obscurin-like n=1 Tax=Anneissia japonica TaxID=1529436 RepID=UPI001425B508|nr:obscurin-like [Anneissia japonica]
MQKAPARKRLPSLRPMNMQIGVDTNIYSAMSLKSEPPNNKPGPSYFVLDENYYDIKKNEDTLKKSKEIDSRDRYAVSLEEVGSFKLTIKNLIPSDAGVYQCTAMMKNDETHLKTMTLFVKPKLVAHVRDVKVEEGSSVATIICELFPKDSDIKTTTWYKGDHSYTIAIASSNDDYIKANPKYEALIDEEKGRALLIIKTIIVEDRGKYVCVAQRTGNTGEGSSASGEGTLSVACNLTVRVYNQKAFIGDESTFLECRILPPGEDIIGVMWYRYNEHGKFNGSVLASTNDIARPDSKYTTCIEEGGRCILYIHSVVKGDAGKYVCKVKRTFKDKFFKGSAVLTVETKSPEEVQCVDES